jgi:hypothetical protein
MVVAFSRGGVVRCPAAVLKKGSRTMLLATNAVPIFIAVVMAAVLLASAVFQWVNWPRDDVIEECMLGNGAAPDTAEMEVADTVAIETKGME